MLVTSDTPKLALCSGCKNWTKYLVKAVKSWLQYDVFDSITIVDWSSDEPFVERLRKFDHKSNILRVEGKDKFSITKIRNTAIRFALRSNPDYIMFADADMMFTDFLDLGALNKESYFSGVRHSTGTAIFPAECFYELNGYNETVNFRGSDQEFYQLLIKLGLETRRAEMIGKMRHIRHPYNQKERDLSDNYVGPGKWRNHGVMELQECMIYAPNGKVIKEIV